MVEKPAVKEKPKTVGTDYAKIPRPGDPKIFKNQNHAKTSACNLALIDAMNDFGIKAWGLARLLGLPWLHQIYQWFDGTQRPSQIYAIRLIKLYQLQKQGWQIITIHHIDWEGDGTIHEKERVTIMPDGTLSPRRHRQTLSPEDQELRDKFMAHSPR